MLHYEDQAMTDSLRRLRRIALGCISVSKIGFGLLLILAAAQPVEFKVLENEHRLSVLETEIGAMNERLSRIETLGYGVVGASALQLFGLFYRRGTRT